MPVGGALKLKGVLAGEGGRSAGAASHCPPRRTHASPGGLPISSDKKAKREKKARKKAAAAASAAADAAAGAAAKAGADADAAASDAYETAFALEMSKRKKDARGTVLHGYDRAVHGETATERLDLRAATKSDKYC